LIRAKIKVKVIKPRMVNCIQNAIANTEWWPSLVGCVVVFVGGVVSPCVLLFTFSNDGEIAVMFLQAAAASL